MNDDPTTAVTPNTGANSTPDSDGKHEQQSDELHSDQLHSDRGPRWNIDTNKLVGAVALTGLLGFSFSMTGAVGAYAVTRESTGLLVNACSAVGLWIGVLIVPAWIARHRASRLADLCRLRFRPVDFPLGAAVGLAAQLAVLPLVFLPMRFLAPDSYKKLSEPAQDFVAQYAGWEVAVLFLVVGVGAPIVEELVFRGFVFGAMAERFAPWLAALASGAIFGAAHFQPLQFPGLMVVGVIFAVLRMRTLRLGSSIIAHATFNMTAVSVLLLTDL